MKAWSLLTIVVVGCGSPAPSAPSVATTPRTSSPAPDRPPCPLVLAALDATPTTPDDMDKTEPMARAIDDERTAVLAAGLPDDPDKTVATYAKNAEDTSTALRKVGELAPGDMSKDMSAFTDAMSTFFASCTTPDCAAVTMLVGAYTMHVSTGFESALVALADQLDKVTLADPKMQADLVKFSKSARRAGASLKRVLTGVNELGPASAGYQASRAELEKSRAALRKRCPR